MRTTVLVRCEKCGKKIDYGLFEVLPMNLYGELMKNNLSFRINTRVGYKVVATLL